MPRMHTLVDPFELALPTPTPSGVVPRVDPRASPLRTEDMRPAVHSETRSKEASFATHPDLVPPGSEPPISDARARARGWCSEE